jgi:hypothetical protein
VVEKMLDLKAIVMYYPAKMKKKKFLEVGRFFHLFSFF